MQITHTTSNVLRFPRERRRLDLDALTEVEPDIMLADPLAERFDLEILPFDLIDTSEQNARDRIAAFDQSDREAFHAQLRAMSESAFTIAITLCLQARKADQRAATLRATADAAALTRSRNYGALDLVATEAERTAAIVTLQALTESHRARGIDAATSLQLAGIPHHFPFGLVAMFESRIA